MGKFLASEKVRQVKFKRSDYFSVGAQADGIYKTNTYPFCLPRDCAGENLFAGIRERLELANIPEAMKGFPIALISAGLMALAFFGFSGLV